MHFLTLPFLPSINQLFIQPCQVRLFLSKHIFSLIIMATKKKEINDDSASDLVSSLMSIPAVHNAIPPGIDTRHNKTKGLHKKPPRSTRLSSSDSHTSSGSIISSQTSTLSNAEAVKFRRCIEREKDALERSDAGHCCYIEDRPHSLQAHEQLAQDHNGMFKFDKLFTKIYFLYINIGTYFVRPATLEEEQTLNIKYLLAFVCHKQVVEVPICCDKEHRAFWFLSGKYLSLIQSVFTSFSKYSNKSLLRSK
jgi:hypothetical protein